MANNADSRVARQPEDSAYNTINVDFKKKPV
jgi:hypothetical protein